MATIHAWSTKWLVNFNAKKTEAMTTTRKINKPLHPPLIMNNTIINQVTEHKHLGLDISNDGRSVINIIKNRGPRIDPWGTPALIVRHLECALSITTRCFLSARYFFIHNNKDPCVPIFSNL
jgi:hypothetical protein